MTKIRNLKKCIAILTSFEMDSNDEILRRDFLIEQLQSYIEDLDGKRVEEQEEL